MCICVCVQRRVLARARTAEKKHLQTVRQIAKLMLSIDAAVRTLALSDDGGYTWGGNNDQKVYQNVVKLVGGGTKILSRRERPHVVLGNNGAPVGLTNGVTEAW